MKNQIAKTIKKVKIDTFKSAMQICVWIMTIALNDEFGFGKERLQRLEVVFNELFEEYGCLVTDDISYGNAKLKKRVDDIMKNNK